MVQLNYKKLQNIKVIMRKQQQKRAIIPQNQQQNSEDQESSVYSSEDQNAYLLTQKVQQKLLQTVAKLKSRDPSIYKVTQPIFQDNDFQEQQQNDQARKKIKNDKKYEYGKKFTYKDMLSKGIQQEAENQKQQLAPVLEQKKAKNKFKQALKKQKDIMQNQNQDELFTVKGKLKKQKKQGQNQPQNKQDQFMKKMKPQTQKLIKSVWHDEQNMDQTDLFLKDYILSKKWMSKKASKGKQTDDFERIDEEDQQRSIEMDQYQAKYNFRFQQPQGDKIVQYPRKIQQSMRVKAQTRKQKRKKVDERKKEQEKQIREQAQQKKKQLRENILSKLQQKQLQLTDQNQEQSQNQQFDHDWFFCDDCGKAFQQDQPNYQCQQCEDYMLCQDCYQLIIHKHPLVEGSVPQGFGAPKQSVSTKILQKLQPCKTCRRKLPTSVRHYQFRDRSQNVQLMCEKCYQQSGLDIKKKFSLIQAKINKNNIQEILEKDPQKVKQLTNSKQIEEMVDEYLKYQFEDVIGGGVKTKFKYITVHSESYGLSDEQILFGDDKELNRYVSIKKLAPYRDQNMKLRNNIYKKKVVTIDRTVKENKKLIQSQGLLERRLKKSRAIEKIKKRSQILKKKRQTKLKILNLSNPDKEKKIFVPSSRLASYGVTLQTKEQHHQ